MLDFIVELVAEIIFGGAEAIIDYEKAPIWLRILAATIILTVVLGLGGLLIWSGINEGEMVLILLGVGVLILFGIAVCYRVIKYKKKK